MYHGFAGPGFMSVYSWGGIGMGVLLLVLVVLAFASFIRSGRKDGGGSSLHESRGLEILEERFARGEITPDQFRSMKAELLGGVK